MYTTETELRHQVSNYHKNDTIPFPYNDLNETALIEIPSDSAIASTISKPTCNQHNHTPKPNSHFQTNYYYL